MTRIINKIFVFLKNVLLLLSAIITVYIIVFMYRRLGKDIFGTNFLELFSILLPFLVLLILSVINMFIDYKNIKENLFFNITSFLAVLVISIFCYRAKFDSNMILWHKYEYNINFTYFSDQIPAIKTILYGLSGANILMLITAKLNNLKDKKEIENSKKELKKENKTDKKVNKKK